MTPSLQLRFVTARPVFLPFTRSRLTVSRHPVFAGQRPLERLVQRELVARILDQEHGDAAAVIVVVAAPRENAGVPVEPEAFHIGPVRGVRPVERPGQVFAGQQRSDQLEQHGRADQEPFDAGQPAGGGRVQREFSRVAATPGKGRPYNVYSHPTTSPAYT